MFTIQHQWREGERGAMHRREKLTIYADNGESGRERQHI